MIMKKIFVMFLTQLYLELKIRMRYLTSSISDLVIYAGTFIAILFFTSTSELGDYYHTNQGVFLVLIGYLFWGIGTSAMDTVSECVEGDAQAGILELELQCIFPIWIVNFIKNIADNVYIWIYLMIISFFTCLISNYSFIGLLWLFILTIVFSSISNLGMFGIGLLFGAGSIHFKHMGQWATVLQAVLILVSNVAVPLQSKYQEILPIVGGIEIVRSLFLGKTVNGMYYIAFIGINIFWLLIGIVIFNLMVSYEKKNGSFEVF